MSTQHNITFTTAAVMYNTTLNIINVLTVIHELAGKLADVEV